MKLFQGLLFSCFNTYVWIAKIFVFLFCYENEYLPPKSCAFNKCTVKIILYVSMYIHTYDIYSRIIQTNLLIIAIRKWAAINKQIVTECNGSLPVISVAQYREKKTISKLSNRFNITPRNLRRKKNDKACCC